MKRKIKRSGAFYVYILECGDGTYYTGYTNDIEKRVAEHNNSKRGAKYTKYKRPVKLVWCKEYRYFRWAVRKERAIKKLRRYQKEELINERQR
ncbi:MAG: GIY-YIG nuclease family protein [Candidatus Omnitrophica bacterium]|nr:GIY-YIG nuclease family protein [Candidatus Omnitrophota bacterium]